ncbi:MAG: hypothetical protein Q4P78_02265 [Rothia sp. (in: high G+C Gram-positive bacteria)]|uniref:hypothetical protein n=1 Tax=Rothia sp. (in: high G+C Gram-positive bacteria) TaxID=1885016 RepID=UPI0026DFFC03|nr:hypothetical protein [Rothia sp. (in: high G+C Gram-positive bacteria)]MDO5750011.1 hypothetical protein [Rothia sp. (in: high G+C Gram-positive bacteria)]
MTHPMITRHPDSGGSAHTRAPHSTAYLVGYSSFLLLSAGGLSLVGLIAAEYGRQGMRILEGISVFAVPFVLGLGIFFLVLGAECFRLFTAQYGKRYTLLRLMGCSKAYIATGMFARAWCAALVPWLVPLYIFSRELVLQNHAIDCYFICGTLIVLMLSSVALVRHFKISTR